MPSGSWCQEHRTSGSPAETAGIPGGSWSDLVLTGLPAAPTVATEPARRGGQLVSTDRESTERLGGTAAALCAVVVVSAALAVASPAFAQITPSPDPDPQIRPDPVTTTSQTTPSRQPVTHAPAVRIAPQPVSSAPSKPATVTTTAPQSSSPRVAVSARRAHPTRRASKPHPARRRTAHDAAVAAWRRVAVPTFPPLAAPQGDDRSQARELSLAAIALLLVVIAGGSLLRMTRDVHRGRPA
jgi:hypothetical protein